MNKGVGDFLSVESIEEGKLSVLSLTYLNHHQLLVELTGADSPNCLCVSRSGMRLLGV